MASPTNYTLLKQTVIELAEDTSSEFEAFIPTAINTAEDRLFRLVDYDFSKSTTLTTVNGGATVNKPADYRIAHHIYISVNGVRQRLVKKTSDFIIDYWPDASITDIPKYYADEEYTTWTLAPTPNGVYNLSVHYTHKPLALSDSNPTNVISLLFPDMLLYATMSNVAEWKKDQERKAEWEQKLQEALESTNNEGRRYRQDDNTHTQNPEGGVNTVIRNTV